jgi:hypothetical protein
MESKLYYKNENCNGAGKVEWFEEDPGIDYIEIGDKRDAIELSIIWEKSDRHFFNKIAANIKKEVL